MRTYEKNLLRKDEAFFFLAFIVYITSIAVTRTSLVMELPFNAEKLLKLMRYGAYFLCCVKILMTCVYDIYEQRQALFSVIALLIAAVIVLTNNKTLLMVSIVFFAAMRMDTKRVLKTYEIVIGALLAANIIFALSGITTNHLFASGSRQRWALGYNWTTVAPITYMFLVFGYLYLRQNRTRVWEYILLLAAAVWFYLETDTRYTFVLTVLYIVVCFFNRYMNRNPWLVVKSIGKYNLLIPVLIAAASIAMYFLYVPGDAAWEKLNTLLSNRLHYGYNAINNYKLTLFGQRIEWVGHGIQQELGGSAHSEDFLDGAYIRILYLYGVVGLSLIVFMYMLGIHKSIKHGDWHLLTIFLFVLLFCVFEFWIDTIDINPFPLLAVTDFMPNNKKRPVSFQHSPISGYA